MHTHYDLAMQISLTELRRTPGPALDQVRAGEEVLITEAGVPLGRLVPVGRPTRYAQLIAAGLIKPPAGTHDPLEIRAHSLAHWQDTVE
jgi:prevent-host-death family protein